jgi:hypothetical protein
MLGQLFEKDIGEPSAFRVKDKRWILKNDSDSSGKLQATEHLETKQTPT